MKMFRFLAALLVMASFPVWALAQQAIQQGGAWTPNHAPMYVPNGYSQPIVQDSGPAGGGGTNLGLSEMLLTQRSPTNTYPAQGTGTGPFGTNLCDYDAPLTNSAGYHYICLGPNVLGVPTIAVGSGGGAAPTALNFLVNGVTYPLPLSGSGAAVTSVINNAALQALSTVATPTVQRLSYATPGDSPALVSNASGSACSLNSGAGDNGSQVRSANGLCWIASFPTVGGDIRQWGCGPSYTAAVNTVCMQAAVNAMANNRLSVIGGPYLMNAVTATASIDIFGTGGGLGIYVRSCTAGLRQATANINLLTMQWGGSVNNLCIDQNTGVTNTSGAGIYVVAQTSFAPQTRVYNNQVNNACYGISLTGTGTAALLEPIGQGNTVLPASTSGCAGFQLGALSTGGATTDVRLTNNSVYCGDNTATALLVKDSGGLMLSGNIFGFHCQYGTYLNPGSGQSVLFTQAAGGVLGDTSNTHDLYIDTAANNATLFANYFTGSWGSSATGGSPVYVRNTAGSPNVSGLYFRNFITYAPPNNNGIDIGDTWFNVNIQDSTICASGISTGTGIVIGGAVSKFTITGNRIDGCDNFNGGSLSKGISITSSATDLGIVSDNNIGTSTVTTPLDFAATGAADQLHFVLGVNKGVDDVVPPPIASAATISIPPNPVVFLSGTTTITNIVGDYWQNRTIKLILQSAGSISYATGGSGAGVICNPVTSAQFQTVTATYSAGDACWLLQGP